MLSLKLKLGDDFYLNEEQVILLRDEGTDLVVRDGFGDEHPIPFGDEGFDFDGGVLLYSKRWDQDPNVFMIGIVAPSDVLILTGRNYRKAVHDS